MQIKKNNLMWHVILRLSSFIIFILVLLGLNLLKEFIYSPILFQIIDFLNANILLILLISVFLIIGDIFWWIQFPFDLPSPFFYALGGVAITSFIIKMVTFVVKMITGQDIGFAGTTASYILYPLVFIIVMVIGYVNIFSRIGMKKRD
jgi:hypothetical protein